MDRWLTEARTNADEKSKVILVGNKSDLENHRQVSSQDGK